MEMASPIAGLIFLLFAYFSDLRGKVEAFNNSKGKLTLHNLSDKNMLNVNKHKTQTGASYLR